MPVYVVHDAVVSLARIHELILYVSIGAPQNPGPILCDGQNNLPECRMGPWHDRATARLPLQCARVRGRWVWVHLDGKFLNMSLNGRSHKTVTNPPVIGDRVPRFVTDMIEIRPMLFYVTQ